MTKIANNAVAAFLSDKAFTRNNDRIVPYYANGTKYTEYWLYDTCIAKLHYESDAVSVHLGGYNTKTTRDRLNHLDYCGVTTHKGQAYLNGAAWDGDWVTLPSETLFKPVLTGEQETLRAALFMLGWYEVHVGSTCYTLRSEGTPPLYFHIEGYQQRPGRVTYRFKEYDPLELLAKLSRRK